MVGEERGKKVLDLFDSMGSGRDHRRLEGVGESDRHGGGRGDADVAPASRSLEEVARPPKKSLRRRDVRRSRLPDVVKESDVRRMVEM
jgi:hypothetical protein